MVSQKRITAYPAWWLVLWLVWLIFCWDQVQISNLFVFEFLYLFLVYNFINNYWTLLSSVIIFKTGHYVPVIIVSVSLCFVASFLFKRSFLNFLFPEHPFYLMMNNFLLQRPALDIRDLPLFYSMFNSSTMQVRGSLSLNCTPLHEILGKVSLLWESDDYIDLYWVPAHLIDPGQMLETCLVTGLPPSPIAFSLSRVLGVSRYWAACGKVHFLVSRHQFYLAGFSNHYLRKHVQGCM